MYSYSIRFYFLCVLLGNLSMGFHIIPHVVHIQNVSLLFTLLGKVDLGDLTLYYFS